MMYVNADLLDDVSSGTYDQTKTMIRGRVSQKTIDGDSCLGPPLNKFVDVFTDSALTPAATGMTMTANGRIFNIIAENVGLVVCSLHEINYTTGVTSYIGKIQFTIADTAATTHTYRSLRVIDTGTTNWKIILTTVGSVAINGGSYVVNKVAKSDFVPVGFPTIGFATGNDQKAVYLLQDPANIGVGQLQIASTGAFLNGANDKLYVHNGISATHQYYVYDMTATLNYSTSAITGTESTNTINHAGHAFVAGDPITFSSLSGGAGLTNGTVYFVRDVVPSVSYSVSATTGGAAINFTTDIVSGNVGRAFGTCSSAFLFKTGNLPALSGTMVLLDSEDYALPQHSSNSGQDCAFFSTTTNLYMGQLSELTSGVTTWPSLNTVNLLGVANEIVTPTTVISKWSNVLDCAIFTTNIHIVVLKKFVNNQILKIFSGINNKYQEGITSDAIELQMTSVAALNVEQGWIGMTSATVGQRGVYLCDLRSDEYFEHSYIVTKVLDTPSSIYKFITTVDKLFEYTGSLRVQYRTSGFGSESGGWLDVPFSEYLDALSSGEQVQFKIFFDTLALDTCIHAQLVDFILGYTSLNETSPNWEFSFDDTESSTPTKVSYRLKKAYASSVPNLNFRSYDLTDTLVVSHTTSANPTRFEYSIDGGENWSSLGTIPNSVGTLLRYTFASQPSTEIRPSLREA